jgi:hypothetical protein
MNKYLFAILLMAVACTDEKIKPREYPRLETLSSTVQGETVFFRATILTSGKASITDHGFTWSQSFPNIRDSPKISLGTANGAGEFTGSISTSGLVKGRTYTVRAFAISGVFEVYGTDATFILK